MGLVHDYLLVMRGAERTFAALAEIWPGAPIYTTVYSSEGTDGRFDDRAVHTSGLQRLRVRQRGFRSFLPLYPRAVERLPVGEHELVVSSSSAFAHGVRPASGAVHVCYCHTPFRYAYHARAEALAEVPAIARPLLTRELDRIADWDRRAAERVTRYVANSAVTRERIERTYGREAAIVHPPVEVDRFEPAEPGDSFLLVGELVPHKRADVALAAARRARVRLTVVGTGPELDRLRGEYPEAEFLGRIDDAELAARYAAARALVVPNVEEFGIVAVEAQAAGRPVVAVAAGGVLETVRAGETGILLERGDADEFAQALRDVDFEGFDPLALAEHAASFGPERFRERFRAEVESARGLS